MSKYSRNDYLCAAFFSKRNSRNKSRNKAYSRRAKCYDKVWRIYLRREKIAHKVTRHADDRSRNGSEKRSRQNYRQIFKGDPEKSASEIEKAFAKYSSLSTFCFVADSKHSPERSVFIQQTKHCDLYCGYNCVGRYSPEYRPTEKLIKSY